MHIATTHRLSSKVIRIFTAASSFKNFKSFSSKGRNWHTASRSNSNFSNLLSAHCHQQSHIFCHSHILLLSFNLKTANMSSSKSKQENDTKEEETSSKSKTPPRYATRGNILTEQMKCVEEAKDKIFSMDIATKRKLYLCKSRYTELDAVKTWPEYHEDELADSPDMQRWWQRNKRNVISEVNSNLNEKMSIFRGDITTLEIDAIVNAANESLLGGGGVDGAIHRAAGRDLLMECELLNGCKAGDAKITCGYKLPAKHVIHTVGPRGEKPEVLERCYKNCMDLVKKNNLKAVAFPCISTGIFGYPNLNAAKVVLSTIRQWLENDDYSQQVERIIFCLFMQQDVDIYQEQLQLLFPLVNGGQ